MHDDPIYGRTRIELGSMPGYVFFAECGETLCFVPEHLVVFAPDGAATLDLMGYFLAGWSVRNLRWSDGNAGGSHVFPDVERPVAEGTSRELPAQVQHWRRQAGLTASFLA